MVRGIKMSNFKESKRDQFEQSHNANTFNENENYFQTGSARIVWVARSNTHLES